MPLRVQGAFGYGHEIACLTARPALSSMYPMRGVHLLRVRGVPIEAHWSLPLVVVYWVLLFATTLTTYHPEVSSLLLTALALASAFTFLVSIVLHELGHSLQARREGLTAERITLWGLGGLAWSSGSARRAGADYRIVAAGPLVTLLVAVVFGALTWLAESAGLGGVAVTALAVQAFVNLGILVFNLLPVYPLDGGQLTYSALWRLRGYASAAVWTPRIGTGAAALMIATGVVGPFVGFLAVPFTGEARPTALSFMVIGVILLRVTREVRPPASVVRPALRARQVADLLQAEPVVLSSDTTPGEFIRGLPRARGYSAGVYPVLEDGRVVGIVSPGLALDSLERGDGDESITATMVRKGEAVELSPWMSIDEGFAALSGDQTTGVVVDGGRVLGILRRADLARAVLEDHEAANGSVVPVAPEPVRVSW